MEKLYMIILEGQGDTDIMVVDQELWDWVFSPNPLDKSGEDPTAPQKVLDELDDGVYITVNSYENDRCLHIGDAAEEQFFSMKEALDYLREAEVEIEDTYEGYIY